LRQRKERKLAKEKKGAEPKKRKERDFEPKQNTHFSGKKQEKCY